MNEDLHRLRQELLEERSKLNKLILQEQQKSTSVFTAHPIVFVVAFTLGAIVEIIIIAALISTV